MATVINRQDLIDAEGDLTFRGHRSGAGTASFIWARAQPGEDPRLHRHAYPETFTVLEGTAAPRVGDEVITANAGDIMVADTIFRIASMAKAVAALQLRDEVAFTVDDPIERWLPELAQPQVLRTLECELDDTVSVKWRCARYDQ